MRKLVGGDENSLMGKAESMLTRNSFALPMGREMLSRAHESWALSQVRVAWQEKHCHSEHPYSLLHPAVLGDLSILQCGTVSLAMQCWGHNPIPLWHKFKFV